LFKKDGKDHNKLKDLPPCTFGAPIIEYLSSDDVMDALHIPKDAPRAPGTKNKWDLCRGPSDGFNYEINAKASQWIWEALKGKYRFLKYSGDTDAAVPTTGTKWWIDSLKWDVLSDWRPYILPDGKDGKVMGGYIIEYDGLTLGTVHGAGHMTPQFKPRESYWLIFNWLFERDI